jgi:hypothetical protein
MGVVDLTGRRAAKEEGVAVGVPQFSDTFRLQQPRAAPEDEHNVSVSESARRTWPPVLVLIPVRLFCAHATPHSSVVKQMVGSGLLLEVWTCTEPILRHRGA